MTLPVDRSILALDIELSASPLTTNPVNRSGLDQPCPQAPAGHAPSGAATAPGSPPHPGVPQPRSGNSRGFPGRDPRLVLGGFTLAGVRDSNRYGTHTAAPCRKERLRWNRWS